MGAQGVEPLELPHVPDVNPASTSEGPSIVQYSTERANGAGPIFMRCAVKRRPEIAGTKYFPARSGNSRSLRSDRAWVLMFRVIDAGIVVAY